MSASRGLLSLCVGFAFFSSAAYSKVWEIAASDHVEHDAQEALIQASPGDTVLLPAGRFNMSVELTMTVPHVTLKGAGMDKTILVYGEAAAGPQAIVTTADYSTIEDLAIVDHPGDGIKAISVTNPTIRRCKVEWTKRDSPENGAYGLYPVFSRNVLLEDNVVIGASDSGIYVGQSNTIVVRRNRAEYNVAGIEIENSQFADVYDNYAYHNTGGILVFNLPNLLVQNGRGTRLYQNTLTENNNKNFAAEGNSVSTVPQGTGILILSNDDVEIFNNDISGHNTTSIAIANYSITERAIEDKSFDSVPEGIYIHDNKMRDAGKKPLIGGNKLGLVAAALSVPHRVPHIVYDGLGKEDGKGGILPAKLEGDARICLDNNDYDGGEKAYIGNLQLWQKKWWMPFPGWMDRDLTPFSCQGKSQSAVRLADLPPLPAETPKPSEEETARLCSSDAAGINWAASAVDCPKLSDYKLFMNPADPLQGPAEGGYPYDLTTPLFSDYASKDRVLFLPPGTAAGYKQYNALDLPVGAMITKTFYFPAEINKPEGFKTIVETRLLIHRESGWEGLVYLWDGKDARLVRGGAVVKVSWLDAKGVAQTNDYRVPNLAQCNGCHSNSNPIGVKAGYMNREGHGALAGQNQLQFLAAAGRLTDLPADEKDITSYPVWNKPETGSLGDRARAYLDINCAHCHNVAGKANTSGLFLNHGQEENVNLGFCKPPIAAGRGAGGTLFDIVPGKPEESILVGRLDSTKAAIKMPELAKGMVHKEGVQLVSEWIKSLKGGCADK